MIEASILFTIHCSKNGGGGIEAYFIGRNLYYRVLSKDYNYPNSGSNGVSLGEYKTKTWYFLGLEHQRVDYEIKGIKTYERPFLKVE